MGHIVVEAAEKMLDESIPVLDHGFVRLVDYMGGDARVEQAARVSYQAGTRRLRDTENLIRYLMKHKHSSPFEQVELVFHVKAPLFVVAQWVRHRTAHINSMSARYSEMPNEFYIPEIEKLRKQDTRNKQAGGEPLDERTAYYLQRVFVNHSQGSYDKYKTALSHELAREHARMLLPQNLYTEFFWKIDLHNLMHFIHLRDSSHAQPEIQEYAAVLSHLAEHVAPISMRAFHEFVAQTVSVNKSLLSELREFVEHVTNHGEIDNTLLPKLDELLK